MKRGNPFGVAGFVVSIVGLVVVLAGGALGLIFTIPAFAFSLVGLLLKNRKRGLSIAGMAISSAALIIALIALAGGTAGTQQNSVDPVDASSAEPEISEPELSESDYRESCRSDLDYKDLLRTPDQFKGELIAVTVEIKQVMDSYFSGDEQETWRGYTDNSGYEIYFDDEYFFLDDRADDLKILEGDVLTVYGEFRGVKTVQRVLTGTEDEVPVVSVKYVDLLDD